MLILKILLSCLFSFYLLKGRSCFSKIWSPGKNLHAAPFCFIRTLQAAFVLKEWCQIDPHYELIPIYHFQFYTFLVTEMSQKSRGAPAAGFSIFSIVVQLCQTISIKIQFCLWVIRIKKAALVKVRKWYKNCLLQPSIWWLQSKTCTTPHPMEPNVGEN